MNEPGWQSLDQEPAEDVSAVEDAETAAGIQRGLEQMKRGEGRPAEVVFAELHLKFNIPVEVPDGRTPKERAAAFVEWAERERPDTPLLSDEAVSRESMYGERG